MEKEFLSYSSTEIRLISLLLGELPDATFEISEPHGNSKFKTITVFYPAGQKGRVEELISAYLERRAQCDYFRVNKAMANIRDAIYGTRGRRSER